MKEPEKIAELVNSPVEHLGQNQVPESAGNKALYKVLLLHSKGKVRGFNQKFPD
jgi:hypothetical protein